MGARCQGGCGEKENRRTRRTRTVCCRNREVPETGTLRGVGGEAFLPYPICTQRHGTSSGEKAIHPTATQQFLKSSSNHAPTTTQPSFVSNPRTIPTQPSHIRDSPNPTTSSCMALARPSTASAVASLPAPPATRRISPSCWQCYRERRRRGETQNP